MMSDEMMMSDCFLEDDIIDDTVDDKEEMISSFAELMSHVSDSAVKQLVRRVGKLEIMEDLEHGRDIQQKLQFLSND